MGFATEAEALDYLKGHQDAVDAMVIFGSPHEEASGDVYAHQNSSSSSSSSSRPARKILEARDPLESLHAAAQTAPSHDDKTLRELFPRPAQLSGLDRFPTGYTIRVNSSGAEAVPNTRQLMDPFQQPQLLQAYYKQYWFFVNLQLALDRSILGHTLAANQTSLGGKESTPPDHPARLVPFNMQNATHQAPHTGTETFSGAALVAIRDAGLPGGHFDWRAHKQIWQATASARALASGLGASGSETIHNQATSRGYAGQHRPDVEMSSVVENAFLRSDPSSLQQASANSAGGTGRSSGDDREGVLPANLEVNFKPYPRPAGIFDIASAAAGGALNLLLGIAFLYPSRNIVASVVQEKELRLREGMKIFGLQVCLASATLCKSQ